MTWNNRKPLFWLGHWIINLLYLACLHITAHFKRRRRPLDNDSESKHVVKRLQHFPSCWLFFHLVCGACLATQLQWRRSRAWSRPGAALLVFPRPLPWSQTAPGSPGVCDQSNTTSHLYRCYFRCYYRCCLHAALTSQFVCVAQRMQVSSGFIRLAVRKDEVAFTWDHLFIHNAAPRAYL